MNSKIKKITKKEFIEKAANRLNYHGSVFKPVDQKQEILEYIEKNIDESTIMGNRTLTNKTLKALKLSSDKGCSYLDISGKSCEISTFEKAGWTVFIITDDIDGTLNIIVYSQPNQKDK